MKKPADLIRQERYNSATTEYTLAIITDEDHASKVELDNGQQKAWTSKLRYDTLYRNVDKETGKVSYTIEAIPAERGGEHQLLSFIAENDRGAEFSELVKFGERLLTFDDRTGLVCEVRNHNQLVPRHILMSGSGDEKFKGFKSEWATLKNDQLIVGSHGRKRAHQWIKILDHDYKITSIDWSSRYQLMKDALQLSEQGYVIHEAAEWHPYLQEWIFFPRKVSDLPYDPARDETQSGNNILLLASEDFSHIRTLSIGKHDPERGISSFKILPGHPNECIGLKSIEIGNRTESYLFCFNLDGEVLQPDTYIGPYKCEGIEIL